jgi:hypothetical protein
LEDHSIWQQVSDDSNADSTNNAMEYGAWQSVLSKGSGVQDNNMAKQFLVDCAAKIPIGRAWFTRHPNKGMMDPW